MRDPAMDFSPKSPTSTTPLGRGRLAQGTQEIPVLLLEHLSLYAGTLSGKSIQERLKVCDTVENPARHCRKQRMQSQPVLMHPQAEETTVGGCRWT